MMGVRGEAAVINGSRRLPPVKAIACGTLSEQLYAAERCQPRNAAVLATLEAGLQNTVHLHEQTPNSVVQWLRDHYNEYHDGAPPSFMDYLLWVIEATARSSISTA
jgi:hypothetical protein